MHEGTLPNSVLDITYTEYTSGKKLNKATEQQTDVEEFKTTATTKATQTRNRQDDSHSHPGITRGKGRAVRVVAREKEDREEMMVMAQFFLLCIEFSSILTGVFL